jgi:hypothetical protein
MKYLLGFFVLVMFGCNHKIEPTVVDLEVHFLLKDKNGNNLYDSPTVDHYHFDEIRVFYMDGDKKVEVYYPNLDYPRNVLSIQEGSIPAIIRFFPYEGTSSETELTTNLIQWKQGDVDTVLTTIRKEGQSRFVDKVTVNGVDKYVEGITPPAVAFGNAWVDRLIELSK